MATTNDTGGHVVVATYADRPAAVGDLDRLKAIVPPGTQIWFMASPARLPQQRTPSSLEPHDLVVDALAGVLIPEMRSSTQSAGVRAALTSRLARVLGRGFLDDVDRELARCGSAIIVLTAKHAAGDVNGALTHAEHLLGHNLVPWRSMLRRRSGADDPRTSTSSIQPEASRSTAGRPRDVLPSTGTTGDAVRV